MTPFTWKVTGVSDQGKKRPNNEDAIGWQTDRERGWLCAVIADGMGGHAAGEVASSMARTRFLDLIEHLFTSSNGAYPSELTTRTALTEYVLQVDQQIKAHAKSHPEDAGLGTTLVAIVLFQGQCWIVNIGDSRCYRQRGDEFKQLTRDDTLVQSWLDNGQISYEKAEQSPYKNVLTQALGAKEVLNPQILTIDIQSGDKFLLCSDGLSNCMTAAFMSDTLQSYPLEESTRQLLDEALSAGAPDNVSLIVIAQD
ncbi:PP2C family protein-serine/threonine phosphatase [Pleionea litopenaei]|uniref:Protein phosphatase 2C domain-containing protein n=1 Tax=Pleionea litopenaei TaxID=3070815 RepID=A0AA51RQP7_9GAMM|nr:protein phosphatase 2C domain-containing protein [Pleionea sp. HL-JVS1]WMS85787.1 protein phosphatase 2C domain-containing protein [Pleionea sp. HL-JVS1]